MEKKKVALLTSSDGGTSGGEEIDMMLLTQDLDLLRSKTGIREHANLTVVEFESEERQCHK